MSCRTRESFATEAAMLATTAPAHSGEENVKHLECGRYAKST